MILSADNFDARTLTLTSEAASLMRRGGSALPDDTRFMTWLVQSESGPGIVGATRVGVEYVAAHIIVVPAPTGAMLVGLFGFAKIRRRR